MQKLTIGDDYRSISRGIGFLAGRFPSLTFYWKMMRVVWRASRSARLKRYDNEAWWQSSIDIRIALESVGVRFFIDGCHNLSEHDGSCVYICNHMGTLETFVLPALLLPFNKLTFIIKKSLVEYPVFGHVMRSCNPIVVGRVNPRDDLKTVFTDGIDRLQKGYSVVVFPQTTRSSVFVPEQFNSIGIKLAKKANVPVVPVALRTDAWGNGKRFKDFGKIDPSKSVHFSFGEPMQVTGSGKEQHEAVIKFIADKVAGWSP